MLLSPHGAGVAVAAGAGDCDCATSGANATSMPAVVMAIARRVKKEELIMLPFGYLQAAA
jgi:hypothetical protein